MPVAAFTAGVARFTRRRCTRATGEKEDGREQQGDGSNSSKSSNHQGRPAVFALTLLLTEATALHASSVDPMWQVLVIQSR